VSNPAALHHMIPRSACNLHTDGQLPMNAISQHGVEGCSQTLKPMQSLQACDGDAK